MTDKEIHITENRAPTDESVRIAEEMREKVLKSILASGREKLGTQILRWAVLDMPEFEGAKLSFAIEIDQFEYKGEVLFDAAELRLGSASDACRLIEEKVENEVRNIVTRALTSSLFHNGAGRKLGRMVEHYRS